MLLPMTHNCVGFHGYTCVCVTNWRVARHLSILSSCPLPFHPPLILWCSASVSISYLCLPLLGPCCLLPKTSDLLLGLMQTYECEQKLKNKRIWNIENATARVKKLFVSCFRSLEMIIQRHNSSFIHRKLSPAMKSNTNVNSIVSINFFLFKATPSHN